MYLPIRRVTKQTVVIIGAYKFANYVHNFIKHPAVKANYRRKLLGINNVDFDATSQLLII